MDKRFIVNLKGKEFVTYEGLLNEAHTKGLKRIATRIISLPDASNGNTCVVTAEVELEGGRVFHGIGDASPQNVNPMIKPHLVRMAETRAKARALRDAVNVGMTAVEELGDGDGDAEPQPTPERSSGGGSVATQVAQRPAAVPTAQGPKPTSVTVAPPTPDEDEGYPDDKDQLTALVRSEMKAKGVSAKQMTEWCTGKGYPPSTKDMTVVQLKVVLRYVRQLGSKVA